ncbi:MULTISPECIES: LysR family transcriptional regulator [unclassified Breznakia]|uniref:LysR family transcriptional regulator n=1 Tax=unclassified Breznakia TaxID=2623764 RepID=UPI00247492CC|nr:MULTISPECIES: LysR family transcriptional regulator [unclassified Breznakia]MDH6367424.1 DNA-binding transcriptional LysR family regulator [Breznakia sp. PH1-1]MDH6403956.1 DNA-binding transcriptional LysR family regulator [Breznakia sp. PF1-11]MDH6411665.1 DNA-binding transcriptional LysR family regulator [Breznakia sp. PFB1-11]MDH6414591.1 DNA-binding transcriptional LysR family regulator [Breznakia sp. PFB1-14]MDH6416016.1 DNA-binding transcriptional LysR family regulator [Breznakia sp. 
MLDYKIKTFLTVCEYLNYTNAAKALNLTQPAITQQIKALEEYYDVKLFSYHNRNLTLTTQGEVLRTAMTTMLFDVEKLQEKLLQTENHTSELNFGSTHSIGEIYLPDIIIPYLDKHKGTIMNYNVDNTTEIFNQLKQGMIDFAFVEGTFEKKEFSYIPISTQRFIAVCNSNRDIPPIDNISELFYHPIILREAGSGGRNIVEEFLKDNGYRIDNFLTFSTFNSVQTIRKLLQADLGIAFVYEIVVEDYIKNGILKEIEIPGFHIEHEFSFVWRKDSLYKDEYLAFLHEVQPGLLKQSTDEF